MFERFEAEVAERARRALTAARQAANLARRLQRAAETVDVHDLRQRVQDAAARAAQAAALLAELEPAVRGQDVLLTGPDADAVHRQYAAAFEQACAGLGVPLEGTYPDYRVFPFDVRIRLDDHRALLGRRSIWTLAPEVLARAVKAERDRLFGQGFAADRFGASLATAYDLRVGQQTGHPPVRLVDILELFQLATFGRNSYSRDEFAFDLYRFRQTDMRVGQRLLQFCDLRGGGAGLLVPTARGTHERLVAMRLLPGEASAVGD